jgi:hypothetical protein
MSMNLAGVILDLYDDPKGLVLRQKAAELGGLPSKVASAELLDYEDLDRLPDRVFALVGTNAGQPIRKYAMHDEAHLLTSLMYFEKCGHLLPNEVRQKVASNLTLGCGWYDVAPPSAVKQAGMLGAAMMGLTGGLAATEAVSGAKEGGDRIRATQAKVASGREVRLTMEQDAAMQRAEGPESGYIFGPLGRFSEHDATHRKLDRQTARGEIIDNGVSFRAEKKADLRNSDSMTYDVGPEGGKLADLTNTEAMTHQTGRTINPSKTPHAKLSSWQPVGDLTRLSTPVTTKVAQAAHYALPHLQRYAIDTAAQVKQAAAYMDEHRHSFDALDRRLFSQTVLHRADELGVKVSGAVLEYGGQDYGPFIDAQLHKRASAFVGTGHEAVYELLLEERGNVSPAVMAEMLKQADEETGASRSYGRPVVGFLDPYASVYGQPKLAEVEPKKEDVFSWRSGGDYVNGSMLKAFASRKVDLDSTFGKGFSISFQSDPIEIFESMPDPQKVVLSRLASDNSSQTFRI